MVRSQPTYSQEVKSFTAGQFHLKTQHQECISSTALLGTRYCLHREMHSKMRKSKELASLAKKSGQSEVTKVVKFRWNPPFLLPFDYDFNICKEAVDFLIADEEKRRALRQKLCLEQGCAQLNVFQYVEWIDDQRQLNVNQYRIRIT
ncbi:hypothetical protein BKA60DRAFT_232327 [Fusarium oxysporum]|nr:hypothetical protein BKA60DRAFT_232327 [Fusarium oxysporum]